MAAIDRLPWTMMSAHRFDHLFEGRLKRTAMFGVRPSDAVSRVKLHILCHPSLLIYAASARVKLSALANLKAPYITATVLRSHIHGSRPVPFILLRLCMFSK